jgi:hypothetical protein
MKKEFVSMIVFIFWITSLFADTNIYEPNNFSLNETSQANSPISDSNLIYISGEVKSSLHLPIAKVKIQFGKQIFYSDSNGFFKIELNKGAYKNVIISFSKDGFEKVSRNYNTTMNSAVYDITLQEYNSVGFNFYKYGMSCGLPIKNKVIVFKNNSHLLDTSIKIELKNIASLMQKHPSFKIEVQCFYFKNKNKALKKYDSFLKFMTNQGQIDKDRFVFKEPIEVNEKLPIENHLILN